MLFFDMSNGIALDPAGRIEVFSIEAFEYFKANEHRIDTEAIPERLEIFPHLAEEIFYEKIDANTFLTLVHNVFTLFSSVTNDYIDPKYTIQQLRTEIDNIELIGLRWCSRSDITKDEFEGLDFTLRNDKEVNLRYAFKIYIMIDFIKKKIDDIASILNGIGVTNCNELTINNRNNEMDDDDDDEGGQHDFGFCQKLIRERYDLNEFVIETKMKLQFDTMEMHHDYLSRLECPASDINIDSGPYGSFRLLYGTLYDSLDDNFDSFYKLYRNICIMYLLSDYLHSPMGIIHIPGYRLYGNAAKKKFGYDVQSFVDEKEVKCLIQKLYNY